MPDGLGYFGGGSFASDMVLDPHRSRRPDEPVKSGWELFQDPHFVVTILSLCLSVSVFFYYLYKLLCTRDDDEKKEYEREAKTLTAANRASADADRLTAARAALDRRIALASKRIEQFENEKAAADAAKAKPPATVPRDASVEAKPATQQRAESPKKSPSKSSPKKPDSAPAPKSSAPHEESGSKAAPTQQLRQRKVGRQ